MHLGIKIKLITIIKYFNDFVNYDNHSKFSTQFSFFKKNSCCFWVAKFRQLIQFFTEELLDFQLLDSNSTIDLSWWWEWHAICTGGHDMWCDGILHSQKLWVYLSAAAVHSSRRGLCTICSENKWTRVESLASSHKSRVTQFESLMSSHLSSRLY